ncbi:helix-turn-helix domain-containing protein [Providencia alcalifaciens]|uniref:helix-turn-helix domain-containing protein n=1 Tax=Providencia alcalifaciens TaxID=126385 RepID=UPI003D95491A
MKINNDKFSVGSDSGNLVSLYCGVIIKRIRKEKGISGYDLAKCLNVSQQQLSRYERGINKLSVDTLFDILTNLDITLERFLKLLINEIGNSDSNSIGVLSLKEKISLTDSIYFY